MNECVDCGQTAWVNSSDEFHNFTTTSTVYSSVEEVCLQSDLMMLWSSSLIAQNFVFRSNTHLNSNMDLVLLRRNRGGRWSGEKKGSFRGANVCGSVWLFWNSWRRLLSYLWISVCVCAHELRAYLYAPEAEAIDNTMDNICMGMLLLVPIYCLYFSLFICTPDRTLPSHLSLPRAQLTDWDFSDIDNWERALYFWDFKRLR